MIQQIKGPPCAYGMCLQPLGGGGGGFGRVYGARDIRSNHPIQESSDPIQSSDPNKSFYWIGDIRSDNKSFLKRASSREHGASAARIVATPMRLGCRRAAVTTGRRRLPSWSGPAA